MESCSEYRRDADCRATLLIYEGILTVGQHSTLKVARHFAKDQGVGVLAILHDLNLAAQYADRIAVLKASELMAIDTPQKVLKSTLIQQTFGYPVLITQHPQAPLCPVVIPQLYSIAANS